MLLILATNKYHSAYSGMTVKLNGNMVRKDVKNITKQQ